VENSSATISIDCFGRDAAFGINIKAIEEMFAPSRSTSAP
jgi:hypothetical protein